LSYKILEGYFGLKVTAPPPAKAFCEAKNFRSSFFYKIENVLKNKLRKVLI